MRMYVALRIWNEYLKAREPRDREAACERFIGKMNGFTALFMGNPPLEFDEDSGKPKRLTFPRIFMVLYRRKILGLTSGIRTANEIWNVFLYIHPCIR